MSVHDITAHLEQRAITTLEDERARIWAKLCDIDDAVDALEARRCTLASQLAEIDDQISEVV